MWLCVACCWEYQVLKAQEYLSAQNELFGIFECSKKSGALTRAGFHYGAFEFKNTPKPQATNDALSYKIYGL